MIERLSGSHNCNACHVGARSAAVEQIVEASRLLAEAGMGDLAELVRQRAREVRERIERGHRDPDEQHARREERRGPQDRPGHERPRRGERRDPDRREGHPQPPELHEAVQELREQLEQLRREVRELGEGGRRRDREEGDDPREREERDREEDDDRSPGRERP